MGRGRAGGQRGAARPVALIGAGLAVGALLLAVAMGQRSGDAGAGAVPEAEIATAADCLAPQVLSTFGLRLDTALATAGGHGAAPAVGRVPSTFAPVGVLVCQTGGTVRDRSGTWAAVTTTTREGTAAQLAALLAALEGAPAPATPSARTTPCAGDGADRVELWLVDPMGRAVRPWVPSDGCGRPADAVRQALEAMAVTDQSDLPVSLLQPAATSPAAPGR